VGANESRGIEGPWTALYAGVEVPHPYGDSVTYRLGAAFIGDLPVEDWGCGLGWYRRYAIGPYVGVDGSPSRFVDVLADLSRYRSSTPALFMRHVLEHNEDWRRVLDNAVASFRRRMVLVLFTPWAERTTVIREAQLAPGAVVCDIAFAREDVIARFDGAPFTEESLATATWYGREHVFYLERPA
jgi:hypothetical protein